MTNNKKRYWKFKVKEAHAVIKGIIKHEDYTTEYLSDFNYTVETEDMATTDYIHMYYGSEEICLVIFDIEENRITDFLFKNLFMYPTCLVEDITIAGHILERELEQWIAQ